MPTLFADPPHLDEPAPPPTPPRTPPRPNAHTARAIAAVVAVALVIAIAAGMLRGGAQDPQAGREAALPAPSASAGAGDASGAAAKPDDAAAFNAAVAKASSQPYHAVFRGTVTSGDTQSTDAVVELWNRPDGSARRDLTVSQVGQRFTTHQYKTNAGWVLCFDASPEPTGPPQCGPAAEGAETGGTGSFGVDATRGPVVMRQDRVAGQPGTCFQVTTGPDTKQQVCFDAAGLPMDIIDGTSHVSRVSVDPMIADADLAVPPTAPTPSSAP